MIDDKFRSEPLPLLLPLAHWKYLLLVFMDCPWGVRLRRAEKEEGWAILQLNAVELEELEYAVSALRGLIGDPEECAILESVLEYIETLRLEPCPD